ncbi:hypothetical protein SteCoe_16768 [Stentor coeruleus]|uniref:DOMON domain-containing protein n=1 Tax=Stentor coeruleus TaxID=5963 RepID=A0A1R2C0K1_9CILI|nr:hypothetical protein SteCoe_16768 [Stentor coeruleus]
MKLFILCSVISLALSGRVCLPKSWILEWSFPDDSHIDFSLTLDSQTLSSYDWVGIGFKYITDGDGMDKADINNFFLTSIPVDSYALISAQPCLDTYFGGTEDILNAVYDSTTLVYTWTREIDSGDIYDKVYTEGCSMKLLWACGMVDAYGEQLMHLDDDKEMIDIILSADYDYGCVTEF